MSKVLIVQNISREGPGLIGPMLRLRSAEYDVVDLSAGQAFPDPLKYNALIVLGGPDSANDQTEKMQKEVVQVTRAIDNGLPYLGICLGMQVLAKAWGGEVVPAPVKEVGWRDAKGEFYSVEISHHAEEDLLFRYIPNPFPVFQLHSETVKPPPGLSVIAQGKWCHTQAIRAGQNAYGLQFHVELTNRMLNEWAEEDADLQKLDYNKLREDFAAISKEYTKSGKHLIGNFLSIAGL